MKKCQNCRANNNNQFCELEYKTEKLEDNLRGYIFEYISPIEKCIKPATRKEYIRRLKEIQN